MASAPSVRFMLPDSESWKELCRNLKLSDGQAAALLATLTEAECGCRDMATQVAKSEVKRCLEVLDRLLSNAHRSLQRADIQQALATLEMGGALSFLLSREAGAEIHDENAVNTIEHDKLLAERNSEVMLYLLDRMRRPIADWLVKATQDKGGSKPKSDRQLLLFLLARDAGKIMGVTPSGTPNSPFHQLCSWVLPACGIGMDGLEEALTRCLKKYQSLLDWAQLPPAEHIVGRLSAAEIAVIPNDAEPGLTC